MEKLLHERLREWAEFTCPLNEAMYAYEIDECSYDDEVKKLFLLFADEIERYYIPRPRFEDDEPVQGGDEFDKGYAHFAVIDIHHPDCYWLLEDYDGCLTNVPIKRPQPKVLDADGVEIKVGDTVWCLTNGGQKGKVKYIHSYGVKVKWEDGYSTDGVGPENLTHKEPDSLEKLQRDIANHWSASISAADSMAIHEWADRLSALIERGA